MRENKVDAISAWSVLQLLKRVEFGTHGVCRICGTSYQHKDDCEMKRHLERLEIESGRWMPKTVKKEEEEDGA